MENTETHGNEEQVNDANGKINTMLRNDIELTFINESHDQNNSEVVIFAKNDTTSMDELAIAWKVIRNCGRNWRHEFVYPMGFSIGAEDSYGNRSDLNSASYGQKWEVLRSNSGDSVELSNDPASSQKEVELLNSLSQGSINAGIYKDGNLFLSTNGISPGQKAVFSFKPILWIEVVSQVEEGQAINSAVMSSVNTKFSLLGISKANIVMRGGGVGPNATPFTFDLVPVE